MLKGDLSSTTLASVLLDLASDSASGSLILAHPDGDEAHIFMRSGLVCGIYAPNRHADLGAKLVSSGILAPEALADAQEAQRTDLSAWNLGELLVHLGYVEESVVQQFVAEQLHETLWDLMRWTEGRWKFRKNAKTREDVPPVTVVGLLETLRERGHEWETIAEIVDSPNAVPMLSARGDGAPETTLDSDAWSMLCKIDGVRTVAELAADCGYTLFEAGQVLVSLVDAGLVDVNEDGDEGGGDVYGSASALAGALAGTRNGHDPGNGGGGAASEDALSRLARLATEVTNHAGSSEPTTNPLQLDVMAAQLSGTRNLTVPISRKSGESFASAMGRVSGALVDALGPAPEQVENDPIFVPRRPPKAVKRVDDSVDLDEQRRRRRAAAAAELAEAQAAVESLRPDRKFDAPSTEAPPRLVDLETERARVAAREAEEAARHAAEGAAREAAEKFAREAVEQAARIQQVQAERAAEEAEREQLAAAAEQAQRDAAQRAEEAARLAAEQEAAEAAAKRAADEAARIAAERAAAEEAARIAAEQLAAEQAARLAAEEAARVAAEEAAAAKAEAAQAAADKAAAEEAARIAAEQAAADRAASEEAARVAAEQAAAEKAAAEEAARVAAEQAAAEEAARVAAEQAAAEEAARVAAEQAAAEEAARVAAEAAARLAEEDAQRQAQAADAERVAQEAEARAALAAAQAQADATAEAARAAQEAAEQAAAKAAADEAERLALEEAIARSQRAAETAAATAMLVELHNTSEPEPEPEPVVPAVAPAPAAAVAPDPAPIGEYADPEPSRPAVGAPGEDADTAALLRELSSLGLEENDRPSLAAATPPPRPRPNSAAADKKAKKKIGLFGL